ncbi:MAG: saccharopine dehydrogenase NADP-binding domain-containing protein [Solirubrobacterales bacterium]
MHAGRTSEGEIVVYGASGYTGRLIAAELARRGAPTVLAGRNGAKLEAVAADLGEQARTRVAAVPLQDQAGLRALIEPAAVVVACAGPFTLHGAPVIEAAARTGTHYLDTTGEQPFIRDSFERWGDAAAESGAALVSGFGFDYVPGDMLAALTAEGLGPLDELTLAYEVEDLGTTRGTMLSALEMVRGGDVEWRDRRHVPAELRAGRGRFGFPAPIGVQRVGRYPSGEQITVPRHVDVDTIRTVIGLRGLIGAELGPAAAPLMTLGSYAMGTPLRGLASKLVERLPEGPSASARGKASFTIVCEARTPAGTRTGVLRGSDVYGITAEIIAAGATRMAADGYGRSGALAPAQAFEPAGFLAALEPHGISVDIDPV